MRVSRRANGVGAGARGNHEDLRGLRVLHVDDSPPVLDAVALRLEPQGVRLTSTTDPREALQLLTTGRRRRFDVLITDLVMPDMDGITLINAAIEARRLPRTLVVSGSQGGPQVAQTLHELGSPAWAGISLPIRYLKKVSDGFDAALLDHLRALRGSSLRYRGRIRDQVLPHLRSVIEPRDVGPEIPTDVRRRRIFEGMLDHYLDLRFTLMLDAEPFMATAVAAVRSLEDAALATLATRLQSAWDRSPRPRREDILQFDRFGWHNFKSDGLVYRNLLSVFIRHVLNRPTLHDLRAPAEALKERYWTLAKLGVALGELRKVGRGRERIDGLAALRAMTNVDTQGRVVPMHSDIPAGELALDLPTDYARSITNQLHLNAREAMQAAGIVGNEELAMTLRSRLVSREAWASALHVAPEADDALGARYRPTMNTSRYWYFGLLNPGDPIAPEVREMMLAGTRTTTKEFGTGMGMTFIHELLREQRGAWLEVQSRDGWTEIGVFTPIPDSE